MKKILCTSYGIIPIVIFIISLSLPYLLNEKDKKDLLTTHPIESMIFKLDSEAKDISLVQKIHKKYDRKGTDIVSEMYVNANTDEKIELFEQLEELIDRNILIGNKKNFLKYIGNVRDFEDIIVSFDNVQDIKEYILNINGQKITCLWDVETSKILSIEINGDGDLTIDKDKEETLKEFISYLNLDVLEDWNMNGNSIQSNKACLLAKSEELEDSEVKYLIIIPTS